MNLNVVLSAIRPEGEWVSFCMWTTLIKHIATFLAKGVDFQENPRNEPYGKVVVFNDVFGNGWDLLQLAKPLIPE